MKEDQRHPPSGCSISRASGWGNLQTLKAKPFSSSLSRRASCARKAGGENLNGAYNLDFAGCCYCGANQLGPDSVCPVQKLGHVGPSYHANRCPGATWTKGHFCRSSSLGPIPSSGLIAGSGCLANPASKVRYLPGEEAGLS